MSILHVALLLTFTFYSQFGHAIYGGRAIDPDVHLSLVTLHLADPDYPELDFFCNGTLIAPNKILTAAHCLDWVGREIYDDITRLTDQPQLMLIKGRHQSIRARRAYFAPSYFEHHGLAGEDLAIVELYAPLMGMRPLPIAGRQDLVAGREVTLAARGLMAEASLKRVQKYASATVLQIDGSKAGLCIGDSGGALLVKNSGQYQLAGILIYDGGVTCLKKNFHSYHAKARF
jgi:secreted trypsin-like serine protease